MDQMLDSGYDPNLISETSYTYERVAKADQLIDTIEFAFSSVVLNDGIGLMQAQALSFFEGEDIARGLRDSDEKLDWKKITPTKLIECQGALFFFDKKGMKFHLPAFMCSELKGEYEYQIINRLTSDFEVFSELNKCQRKAVRDFLSFLEIQPDYKHFQQKITKALQNFWEITTERKDIEPT